MHSGKVLNTGIFVLNNTQQVCIKYGPWDSLNQFKDFIDSDFWSEGLTFALREGGGLVEYWFVGGREETDIELKYESGVGSEARTSYWIARPVITIVSALPGTPAEGERYIHNNIVKEYKDSAWVDEFGGTGFPLQDGMVIIVREFDGLYNDIYIYKADVNEWISYSQYIINTYSISTRGLSLLTANENIVNKNIEVCLGNTTSNNVNAILPLASVATDLSFTFRHIAGLNAFTVFRSGTDNLNFNNIQGIEITLLNPGEWITLKSNGTHYYCTVDSGIPNEQVIIS
jgi:hypothetical protein